MNILQKKNMSPTKIMLPLKPYKLITMTPLGVGVGAWGLAIYHGIGHIIC
jgi:hypothetical protein